MWLSVPFSLCFPSSLITNKPTTWNGDKSQSQMIKYSASVLLPQIVIHSNTLSYCRQTWERTEQRCPGGLRSAQCRELETDWEKLLLSAFVHKSKCKIHLMCAEQIYFASIKWFFFNVCMIVNSTEYDSCTLIWYKINMSHLFLCSKCPIVNPGHGHKYNTMPSVLHLDKPVSTSASDSVSPPVYGAEASRLGRSHHQVLHVPPGQVHAAQTQEGGQGKLHWLSVM